MRIRNCWHKTKGHLVDLSVKTSDIRLSSKNHLNNRYLYILPTPSSNSTPHSPGSYAYVAAANGFFTAAITNRACSPAKTCNSPLQRRVGRSREPRSRKQWNVVQHSPSMKKPLTSNLSSHLLVRKSKESLSTLAKGSDVKNEGNLDTIE